ncbi:MAG: ABC transporter permease [Paracoccaceae bacterium]|nr:ABC transporter permease [Paracoccaceae bacterium]MDE2912858.1 ABC transporter permease [Paracoccaceae bacterium]
MPTLAGTSPILRFLGLRVLRALAIAFAVATIIFFLFSLVPGDQAAYLAGPGSTQAEIDKLRESLGLNDPLLVQYFRHVTGLLRGDFGTSEVFKSDPLPFILERIPATLALTAAAIGLTILIGIPAGLISAMFHTRVPDLAISVSVVALLAVPNFWLGLLLLSFFSVQLGWLPSFGFSEPAALILPSLALAARLIALVARMTRGVTIDELGKDYVRTARSKGLSRTAILLKHVLRNVMIPTLTVIGLQTGYLLGGSVVIERLFAWPGIGDLMINAIGQRDYAVAQAVTILFVIAFLVINLVVELLYVLINPRMRAA